MIYLTLSLIMGFGAAGALGERSLVFRFRDHNRAMQRCFGGFLQVVLVGLAPVLAAIAIVVLAFDSSSWKRAIETLASGAAVTDSTPLMVCYIVLNSASAFTLVSTSYLLGTLFRERAELSEIYGYQRQERDA